MPDKSYPKHPNPNIKKNSGAKRAIARANDSRLYSEEDIRTDTTPKKKMSMGGYGRPKVWVQGDPDFSQPPIPKSKYFPNIAREKHGIKPSRIQQAARNKLAARKAGPGV